MSVLSNKELRGIDLEKLFEVYENQVAYFTRTGSKVRADNIEKCREELRKRIHSVF